jgi:multidrug resistance efflux pump
MRMLDCGRYVVKDGASGAYYELGEQEYFLLWYLDGEQRAEDVLRQFEGRFGQPLSGEELEEFLGFATEQGFLPSSQDKSPSRNGDSPAPPPESAVSEPSPPAATSSWSILYWRVSLFDPDRLFKRLVPLIGFLWTRAFLVLSLAAILLAGLIVWQNQGPLISRFADALNWRTALLVWLTLIAATTLHEFAHGLTCKHYGGEVHEIGFLAMFFLPCLYCNVSDAWLIPERRRRLLVTLAGGYCDLCLWSLAVFVWRLSPPEGLFNYLAWVVLSVLGARVFFNFNPLLKLDGYYLLSDWMGISNLQQRGIDRAKGHFRRLLWGADRPPAAPAGRFLTVYGVASWFFAIAFLGLMLAGLFRYLCSSWGLAALVVVPLGYLSYRGPMRGLVNGEVLQMIRQRRIRTGVWFLGLAALPVVLIFARAEDRASGPFRVRTASFAEVRAPVSGFLKEVVYDEGDRVSQGAAVARLEIPDLETRISQKASAALEAEAKLRLLEAGPRKEEIEDQRHRVDRAREWRNRSRTDLEQARKGLQEDLRLLREQLAEYEVDLRYACEMRDLVKQLQEKGAGSGEQWLEALRRLDVALARVEQARARKQSLETTGIREVETELARREKELGDAEGTLALLEAGSRAEEIQAARAHLAQVREEHGYLCSLRAKLTVASPVGGVVTTPRPKDRVGQYVREGDLICVVEDPSALEVEVAVAEQDLSRITVGQPVELKARSLPFETVRARVERIAPAATRPDANITAAVPVESKWEAPGAVLVSCRLEGNSPDLRPGLTGHARVLCGSRSIGGILSDRVLRSLRTEFWW